MHHGGGGRGDGAYARERNRAEPQVPRNRLDDNERPRKADDDQRITIGGGILAEGLRRPSLEPAGLARAASGTTTASVAAATDALAQHMDYQSREEQKQQGMTISTVYDPWGTNFTETIPFDYDTFTSEKPTSGTCTSVPLNIESNLPSIDLPSRNTRERTSLIPDGPLNLSSSKPSVANDTFSWQDKDAADISAQLDQHIAAMRTATAAAAIESQGRNQFSHPSSSIRSSISSSSFSTNAARPLPSFATAAASFDRLETEGDWNVSQGQDRQLVSSSFAVAAATTNTSPRKSSNIQETDPTINARSGRAKTSSSYAISQDSRNLEGFSLMEEDPNDLLDQLGITEPIYGISANQVIQEKDAMGEINDEPPPAPHSKLKTKEKKKKKSNTEEQFALAHEILPMPRPLAMSNDHQWLTPLHCFVREKIVEVFTATQKDVDAPSRGKRRNISLNQVGIRCPHCSPLKVGNYGAYRQGSVYYPLQISAMYNATMNLLQRHFDYCDMVPKEIQETYKKLKSDEARSGMSKKYWIESAKALGLVDKKNAIWYRTPTKAQLDTSSTSPPKSPIIDSGDLHHSSTTSTTGPVGGQASTAQPQAQANAQPEALVYSEDQKKTTRFTFCLLSQVLSCRFTEADRLGKRRGLPIGFAGLACRHCYPQFGNGRYFPSSLKTLSDTSKTLNVLNAHLLRCRSCPEEIREELRQAHESHASERSDLPFGSQKAFFTKIWERLHGKIPVVQPPTDEDESSSSFLLSSEEYKYSSSASSLKKAPSSSSLKKRARSESDASSNDVDHLGVSTRNMPTSRSDDHEQRIKRSRAA